MGTFNTYSKRNAESSDVFTYDNISDKLKTQIFHIWNNYFNQFHADNDLLKKIRKLINETICEEEGLKNLDIELYTIRNLSVQVENYFEKLKVTEKILDVIEITFYYIGVMEKILIERHNYHNIYYTKTKAIEDLNTRFKENGVGYEYTNDQIIRVDNKLLHKEIIQNTLNFIGNPDYINVNEEFLKAHEHFRFNKYHECLNECLKAFESTMKIVISKNCWELNETATAKNLINILIVNEFFKISEQSYLSAIKNLLEGHIPTIRNKNSGHGQGTIKIEVPSSLASYMLYITGATINYIIDLQQERTNKK